LGIILYALLFGALPFDDDDEEVMKQKIWKGDYEMPKGGDDGVKVGEGEFRLKLELFSIEFSLSAYIASFLRPG